MGDEWEPPSTAINRHGMFADLQICTLDLALAHGREKIAATPMWLHKMNIATDTVKNDTIRGDKRKKIERKWP